MPQSLSKIYIHLVFSTKNRVPTLADDIRQELHNYVGGIFRDLGSPAIEINSQPDHVHALFQLARTQTPSGVVGEIQRGSSVWLKSKGSSFAEFHWQAGYGAFSVSQSAVKNVRKYIRDQAERHRRTSFQEEYRSFLQRHEVEFDEALPG
jgi:putative transposase